MGMTWNDSAATSAASVSTFGADSDLAPLIDELAHGLVVVTACGRLRHANQAAQAELKRARVLAQRGGQIHACAGDGARLLRSALDKAAAGRRSLITLPALGGVPLTLAVVPLRGGTPGSAGVGLVFSRASVCDSLMLCFFARSHGLTGAEETVLGLLCQGLAAPEVAAQLKVAVSTVRSHVRSLCAKTRASGVRDLVGRVALLPPVVAARPGTQVH